MTATGGVYTPILSVNGMTFTVDASGSVYAQGNVTTPNVILAGTSLITRLAAKQNTITDGSLTIARTTGLQTALDSKLAPITDGSLTIAKTSGLQLALDAKQAIITDGSLTIARTIGLQAVLDAKASLAGATFTGNVSSYNLTASGGVYTPILSVNGMFLQ